MSLHRTVLGASTAQQDCRCTLQALLTPRVEAHIATVVDEVIAVASCSLSVPATAGAVASLGAGKSQSASVVTAAATATPRSLDELVAAAKVCTEGCLY